jgi:predicted pyridoxine 5'-phosphate oxidase superfamily flavin-nucleotide-binding protein
MDARPQAAPHAPVTERPGSRGERWLQQCLGTSKRARAFYDNQVLDHVNAQMREYLARQEMMFVSTADSFGNCDCSFRAGPAGFVRPLDERTLVYPEYRGNGVMASLGNLSENPHVALLFLDFFHTTVGLHVNGRGSLVSGSELSLQAADPPCPAPECWVVVEVDEAYIHCSKHVPRLIRLPKDIDWGTDSAARKGGDFFKAKASPAPWKGDRLRRPTEPTEVAASSLHSAGSRRPVGTSEGASPAATVGARIRSWARVLAML